jgi:hypothetical protein
VKKGNLYPCDICNQKFEKISLFKEHIFRDHTDLDVHRKYNRSAEDLIGKTYIDRLRNSMMGKIQKGQFNLLVCSLLSNNFNLFEENRCQQGEKDFPLLKVKRLTPQISSHKISPLPFRPIVY